MNPYKRNYSLFLAISIVYLFFNTFLLPDGLLYTTLLTPFFFLALVRRRGLKSYFIFLAVTLLFAIVQLPTVDYVRPYLLSFVLLQCVAVFTLNAYFFFKEDQPLNEVFKATGTVNLLMLLISLVALFIPLLKPFLWYEMSMSDGLPVLPRLKMLTYEASYYSLIIFPVFAYYLLKKMLLHHKTGILLLSLTVSLLCSLSFGVLAGVLISLVLLYCFHLKELRHTIHPGYLATGLVAVVLGVVCLALFYPHNILFDRVANIINGKDTSARGRTYESFGLAWNIAKMKSVWWGIGPGQLKLLGRDYIIQFYNYSNIPPVARIPNAVAETLNIYGVVGVTLRFAIIICLFTATRVWSNYYRLLLFIFMFIYQFTGSFLFNVAEYVIWVLAFSPRVFPAFNSSCFRKEQEALKAFPVAN